MARAEVVVETSSPRRRPHIHASARAPPWQAPRATTQRLTYTLQALLSIFFSQTPCRKVECKTQPSGQSGSRVPLDLSQRVITAAARAGSQPPLTLPPPTSTNYVLGSAPPLPPFVDAIVEPCCFPPFWTPQPRRALPLPCKDGRCRPPSAVATRGAAAAGLRPPRRGFHGRTFHAGYD